MSIRVNTRSSAAGRGPSKALCALFIPTLADIVLLSAVVRQFLISGGWDRLLGDANIGLQIRTGDWIRSARALPSTDPFSYTHPDRPWYAWEWLFDVAASLWHSAFGLSGIAVAAAAMISISFALTYLHAVRRAGGWIIPTALTFLAVVPAAIHMLARPHLVTWCLVPLSMMWIHRERHQPSWRLWLLVPLTAIWANLHGGFLLLPLVLAVTGAAAHLEDMLRAGWTVGMSAKSRRFLLAGFASLAASCLNPYGVFLHAHIWQFLRAGWVVTMVDEFRPPDPGLGLPYWHFVSFLVLAGIALIVLLRRTNLVDAASLVLFAIMGCRSARHVPLFLFVATPILAAEASHLLRLWRERLRRRSVAAAVWELDRDLLSGFSRMGLLVPTVLVVALCFPIRMGLPRQFPERIFPQSLVKQHLEALRHTRFFTTDRWADFVIYYGAPGVRAWFTGNNDFFGPRTARDYVEILEAGPRTEELMRQVGFGLVLVPAEAPLRAWLNRHPDWREVGRDSIGVLFRKL